MAAPGSGDQSSTNSDLQPPAPQKKSCLTPTISVTYCQPQVTSLPSFAFSSLPQPDTSKLLANLEQKAKAESCMHMVNQCLCIIHKPVFLQCEIFAT